MLLKLSTERSVALNDLLVANKANDKVHISAAPRYTSHSMVVCLCRIKLLRSSRIYFNDSQHESFGHSLIDDIRNMKHKAGKPKGEIN